MIWFSISSSGKMQGSLDRLLSHFKQSHRVFYSPLSFFLFSRSSSSSSSSSRGRLHNYYLRKRRKCPLSSYKAIWQEAFSRQQAMQSLKQSAMTENTNSTHLLSALVDSFANYCCEPSPHAYHFVVKVLTQNPSSWDQIPQVLDRLQNVEKFETPEYIFVYLIRFYGDIDMLQRAVDLFFRIPKFRCTPTVDSLNSLLSVLSKTRDGFRIVPQILMKSQLMNIRIEESSYRVLIKALCGIKKCAYAMDLLVFMINDQFSIDAKICSLIISTMCEEKAFSRVEEVLGFLENMRQLGFFPDRIDWRNVIRFLVTRNKVINALDALNQMKLDGIKPDTVCYTTVLRGVILEGDYARADDLFDEMLVLGLVPDIHTYNVYIAGLFKQEKVEEGIKMLACMEELGCRPNLITYNTLLGGLCESANQSRAKEVLREMLLKGLQPNTHTYGTLIDGLCRNGEIDEACTFLDEMLGKGFTPQSAVIDEVMCGLCHRGLFSKGLKLLNEMVVKNVAPGARTWGALLNESIYVTGPPPTFDRCF